MEEFFIPINYLSKGAPVVKYRGPIGEHATRNGLGTEQWQTPEFTQEYEGWFALDSMHGNGQYQWDHMKPKEKFEGKFYANKIEGYGLLSLPEGGTYEGMFKSSYRFGPGIETTVEGSQNVGFWRGTNLVKICHFLDNAFVPRLARRETGKLSLLRHKQMIPLEYCSVDPAQDVMNELVPNDDVKDRYKELYSHLIRDPKSLFFDHELHDQIFFGPKNKLEIDVALTEEERFQMENEMVLKYQDDFIKWKDDYKKALKERKEKRREEAYRRATSEERLLMYMGSIDSDSGEEECEGECEVEEEEERLYFALKEEPLPKRPVLEEVPYCRKVIVNNLVAWNNNPDFLDMLKELFIHRDGERDITYDITELISGQREMFKKVGPQERGTMEMLNEAALGNLQFVEDILADSNIYAGACDARGNTALLMAAVQDNHELIEILVDNGTDIDHMNNEGFTALNMCITRYLAVQNDVISWEAAFLPAKELSYITDNRVINNWRRNLSLLSLQQAYLEAQYHPIRCYPSVISVREEDQYDDYGMMTEDDVYQEPRPYTISMDRIILRHLFAFDQSDQSEFMNLEAESYNNQKYLFVTDVPPPVKGKGKGNKKEKTPKAKPDKKGKKGVTVVVEEVTETPQQLAMRTIYGTILKLLGRGADANVGTVPWPAILMTLYTKNTDLLTELLCEGADPDITNLGDEGYLTALHILSCFPPSEIVLQQFRIMLDNNANPNIRAFPSSHEKDKEEIIGKRDISLIENLHDGQTPLQMLCFRGHKDPEILKHNICMINMLLQNGAKANESFLGHTALTLAMLKGQDTVVSEMLESARVNPNAKLGPDQYLPLIVLLKMENQAKMDLKITLILLEILITHGGNPFIKLELPDGFEGNVVDFAVRELNKARFPPGKGGKPPKKPKAGKNIKNYQQLLQSLTILARDYHIKWIQGQLANDIRVKTERYITMENESQYSRDEFQFNNLKIEISKAHQWLEPDRLQKVLLMHIRNSRLPRVKRSIVRRMLEEGMMMHRGFFGAKTEESKGELDALMIELKLVDDAKKKGTLPQLNKFDVNRIGPELDSHMDRYQVCFYCSQCITFDLEACTKCNIVKYCSEDCAVASKASKLHPCDYQEKFKEGTEPAEEFFLRKPGESEECYAIRMKFLKKRPDETEADFALRLNFLQKKPGETEESYQLRMKFLQRDHMETEENYNLRMMFLTKRPNETENDFALRLQFLERNSKESGENYELRMKFLQRNFLEAEENFHLRMKFCEMFPEETDSDYEMRMKFYRRRSDELIPKYIKRLNFLERCTDETADDYKIRAEFLRLYPCEKTADYKDRIKYVDRKIESEEQHKERMQYFLRRPGEETECYKARLEFIKRYSDEKPADVEKRLRYLKRRKCETVPQFERRMKFFDCASEENCSSFKLRLKYLQKRPEETDTAYEARINSMNRKPGETDSEYQLRLGKLKGVVSKECADSSEASKNRLPGESDAAYAARMKKLSQAEGKGATTERLPGESDAAYAARMKKLSQAEGKGATKERLPGESDAAYAARMKKLSEAEGKGATKERLPGESDEAYAARMKKLSEAEAKGANKERLPGESDEDYAARMKKQAKEGKDGKEGKADTDGSKKKLSGENDVDHALRMKQKQRRPGETDSQYDLRMKAMERRPGETDSEYAARMKYMARRPGESDSEYALRMKLQERKPGETDAEYKARMKTLTSKGGKGGKTAKDEALTKQASKKKPGESDAEYERRMKLMKRRPGETDAEYEKRMKVLSKSGKASETSLVGNLDKSVLMGMDTSNKLPYIVFANGNLYYRVCGKVPLFVQNYCLV